MVQMNCATCKTSALKPPRLVAGAWFALCVGCLYETEVEASTEEEGSFRVKGVANMTSQQEADLRRPRAAPA